MQGISENTQEGTMSLFGLEFKSREEREREERDYLYRIFPGGNEQKKAVEKELASKLPWVEIRCLLYTSPSPRDRG